MLAQHQFVKSPLMAAWKGGWWPVVDQLRGWRPGDKLLAATFGLAVLSAGGQLLNAVRADYTQTSKSQVEDVKVAATAQYEDLKRTTANQFADLKAAYDKAGSDSRTDIMQRFGDLQAQLSRMNDRFDRLPKPEQVQEIKARQIEDEGTIRLMLNQLSAMQTTAATHEVRLQNLEKGKDIQLPGHR